MKLIVGLGNPGLEYEYTRHNIGFYMLDRYVLNRHFSGWKRKFNGLYLVEDLFGEKVIFLKPQSYMNLSGKVVFQFVQFYHISCSDILVISDDLDLNIGNFKLKDRGSSGGHNGLKDIEKCLHTQEYKRLKIGISHDRSMDTKDYVLGKFSKEEMKLYEELSNTINRVIDDFFVVDFSSLMNQYNCKNR